MDVDIFKGHFSREMLAHHGHTGDPEENNIEACDKGAGGIISTVIIGRFWPT